MRCTSRVEWDNAGSVSAGSRPPPFDVRDSLVLLLKGGLGNQLFQIGAGIAFADACGRNLRIAAPSYALDQKRQALGQTLFPELSRLPPWQEALLAPLTAERLARQRLLRSRVIHDGNAAIGGQLKGPFVSGYFQNIRYTGRVAERLATHCAAIELALPSRFVAVHVRRGDYLSLPHLRAQYAELMDSYYEPALRRALAEVSEDAVAFVVSDEPQAALQDLASRMGVLADRLRPSPTGSVWEDLALMSQATRLVGSNSTFCWWAARAKAVASQVFLPASWIRAESLREGYDFDLHIPGANLL